MAVPCWGCQLPLPTGVTYCPRCGASLADETVIEADGTRIGPRPDAGPARAPSGPYQSPPPPAPYGAPPPAQPWQSVPPSGGSGAWQQQSLPPTSYPTGGSLPPQAFPSGVAAPQAPTAPSRTARTALALGIAFAVLVLLGVAAGFFRGPLLRLVGAEPAATTAAPSRSVPRPTVSSAAPSSTPSSPRPSATSGRPSASASASASSPASKPPASTTALKPVTVTVARTCGSTGKGDCFLTERTQATGDSPALKQWPDKSTLTVVCQVQGQSVSSSVLNRASTVWSRTSTGGYVANIFLDGIDAFAITTPC